ncbi:uncharacterized protein LY79DRAFT_585484 [Colletotrichum navitas]|uniref:Uncharacterized protein n=1 Tax=Colletotrichum navitas TaxID=681940 RepID=A0AAD8PI74_9PEZI|nr:uncharacterized protein LY79DRAFT_585484 [Colletotrichum navitas]KAK1561569.1 hypothetical protein LY79DRAFT_585484 [Colletotrichum navitas]
MPNSLKLRLKDFKLAKANNSPKLYYSKTSIDSKSYLGVIGFEALDSAHTGVYLSKVFKSNIIEGYNIPFSRVIREIKELNTTEKEKVLKANSKRELNYYKEQQKPIVGDLSLFTFLARDLSKPREGPIGNKVNSLE